MDRNLLEKEIMQMALASNGEISYEYIFQLKLLEIDMVMLQEVAQKVGQVFSGKYADVFLDNYYDSFLDIVVGYCNIQLAIFTVEWDVLVMDCFKQLQVDSKVLLEKVVEQTKQVRPNNYQNKENCYVWLKNKESILLDDVWQYKIDENEGYCLFINKSKLECIDKGIQIKVDLWDCSNIIMEYFWLYLSTSRKTSLLKLNFTNQPIESLEALFKSYERRKLI